MAEAGWLRMSLLKTAEFDKITELTKEAVNKMLGFELRHIGINAADEKQADHIAGSFEKLFGLKRRMAIALYLLVQAIEVMKQPYLGKNGHIAIQTNYIDRAIFHLQQQGYTFNEESKKYDKNGKLVAIYLTKNSEDLLFI